MHLEAIFYLHESSNGTYNQSAFCILHHRNHNFQYKYAELIESESQYYISESDLARVCAIIKNAYAKSKANVPISNTNVSIQILES